MTDKTYRTPWAWREQLAGVLALAGAFVLYSAFSANNSGRADGKFAAVFVMCLVGGGLFGVAAVVYSSSRVFNFRHRVASLAPLPGRPQGVVLCRLGPPQSYGETDSGEELLTWRVGRYRVTLGFRGGSCTRVASESTD